MNVLLYQSCALLMGQLVITCSAESYQIEVLQSQDAQMWMTIQSAVDNVNKKLHDKGVTASLELANHTHGLLDNISDHASRLLKSDVIALVDFDRLPYQPCTLSTLTNIPQLRIHGNKGYLMKPACDRAFSMSADYVSFAHASVQILDMFQWKKVALMFEISRFVEVAYFSNLTTSKDYTVSYVPISINTDTAYRRAMRNLAATSVDVILLYVTNYTTLLQHEHCTRDKVYVWIIQDSVYELKTAHDHHMVIGFGLQTPTVLYTNNSQLRRDELLLVQQAVTVVGMALENAHNNTWLPGNNTITMDTKRHSLYMSMKKSGMFDSRRCRYVSSLNILNLINDTFTKIGTWTKLNNRLKLTAERIHVNKKNAEKGSLVLQGRKISVIVVPTAPFVFKDKYGQYTGLCIDILQRLAADLKFTYEIQERADGVYGVQLENGEWHGMVKDLIDRKADMIVNDLTRLTERQKYVAMTTSYMHYTDKMIMKKDAIEEIDYLQFMSPLSVEVWLCVLGSLILVTLSMYTINYFSPYGDEFNLFNCLWFSFSCMLQQGAEHLPKSTSGRVLAGFFWFSVLVSVATYTANLVAFFTVNKVVFPVSSLQTALESDYKLGVVQTSYLLSLLKKATDYNLYVKTLQRMSNLPQNESQALEWVRQGDFIYMSDGPYLDYIAQKRPCDLMTVKALETPRSYVFALNQDDPHINDISLAILGLRENGFIETLKHKYFQGRSECMQESVSQISSNKSIELKSMTGVFLLLGVACGISLFTLTVEIYWKKRTLQKLTAQNRPNIAGSSTGD